MNDYFNSRRFSKWLKCSYSLTKGSVRENMEDKIKISKFHFKGKNYFVFLVLDGHGGKDVAEYVQEHFIKIFRQKIAKDINIKNIIKQTFTELNTKVSHMESGTTSSLLLLEETPDHLNVWSANVGDSSIYAINHLSDKVKKISKDHKPHLKHELKRMKSHKNFKHVNNGYVETQDGMGLAMSRAIGDSSFGDIITAVPTIKKIENDYDTFILASDGLWDVMNGKKAWKVVKENKWEKSAKILNDIRNEKYKQHDNTSILIVYLNREKINS
jgi:serine/threonine protein phosphatase PrpC